MKVLFAKSFNFLFFGNGKFFRNIFNMENDQKLVLPLNGQIKLEYKFELRTIEICSKKFNYPWKILRIFNFKPTLSLPNSLVYSTIKPFSNECFHIYIFIKRLASGTNFFLCVKNHHRFRKRLPLKY